MHASGGARRRRIVRLRQGGDADGRAWTAAAGVAGSCADGDVIDLPPGRIQRCDPDRSASGVEWTSRHRARRRWRRQRRHGDGAGRCGPRRDRAGVGPRSAGDECRNLSPEDRRTRDDREQPPGGKPVRRLRARRRGFARCPQRDRRPARRPPQRGRQRRLAVECARCHHCGQHLPLRSRRHLHDFQPQGPLRRQPLRAACASRSTTCTPTTARSAATSRSAIMSATPSCIRTGW